ncbi:alanine racemase [Gammaproteobacteria bacterium]|nr:alanine racemase [Gammaproteobacteria bacterium]
MIHRVQATINLAALQANFQLAKSQAAHSKMIAVIKANAYGHGLIPVAEALGDADLFAVTDINEALSLKKGLSTGQPILILQGIIDREDIKLICAENFQLVVHSIEQLRLLDEEINKINVQQPLSFWLKMNSGMGRLGIAPAEYVKTYNALKNKTYTKEVIMMTHLANSSLPDSALNAEQLSVFNNIKNELDREHTITTSIPSSSGILADLNTQSDWARPGIMMYGSSPFNFLEESLRREPLGLQNVMTLQSKIIAVQSLKAGDNVGYCSQFICPHDMNIGIVCIGYADGYPSNAPNGTPVLVNDQRSATIGRVSMDMLAIDLNNIPEAKVGDPVILWGDQLSLDEIAEKTGILSYNLTCSISARVKFIYG